MLVVDVTAFLKKGAKSVGVARQYSGTAGRIENSQVSVFLPWLRHAARLGLGRPRPVSAERVGRRHGTAAHGPESVVFATKIVLAKRMVERAVEAGLPTQWVTADAVYGTDSKFRMALETRALRALPQEKTTRR